MSVEIKGMSGRQVQNTGDKRQVASAKSATGAPSQSGAAAGGDRVSLTDSATNLQELTNRVAQLPVVDAGVVSETQTALATGSFQFQPAVAADNLVSQEKELATLEVQS